MAMIASRDLRNHTADVLRRVAAGEHVTVTINGRPVAEMSPVRLARRASLSKQEFIERVLVHQADPGLRRDLERLSGETTDDLGPIR